MMIVISDVLSKMGFLFFAAAFPLFILGGRLNENSKKWIHALGNVVIHIAEASAVIGVFLGIVSALGDFGIVR